MNALSEELTISAIQYDIFWENKKSNLNLLNRLITDLPQNTDLLILPEMFATGFSMNTALLAETKEGETVQWMKKVSTERKIAICGSIPFSYEGSYRNRFLFVHAGEVIAHYDKRHLFSYGTENEHYSSGSQNTIVEFKGWKICLQICYDLRFPVWSRNTQDYDLLLYVASWPDKRIEAWSTLLKARAIENLSYVCGLNRIGVDGSDLNYNGQSAIIDYTGEIMSKLNAKEELMSKTLKMSEMKAFRDRFGFLNDKDEFQIV